MDQKQNNSNAPTIVPMWAIVIITVAIVAIVLLAFFFFRKRMTSSTSVDTIHTKEDNYTTDNKETPKSVSLGSFQTLVSQNQKQRSIKTDASSNSNSFITTTHLPPPPLPNMKEQNNSKNTVNLSFSHNKLNYDNSEKTDKTALVFDESGYNYSPPEPPQEIKISLPLPPSSTSFFSDKMELDGEGSNDLYDIFLSSKNKDSNANGSGFISIDLNAATNTATETSSFYTNTASNIQQKAASIKSSIYRSLRSKQKSINGARSNAQEIFSTANDKPPKHSGDSYEYQPANIIDKPVANVIKNSSTITTDSNKTIISVIDTNSKFPLSNLNVVHGTNVVSIVDDDSPITPNPNLQEPVRAAKSVIRSASRNTKTHSMIIGDPSRNVEDHENDDYLSYGDEKERKRSRHGSIRFASIRGPRSNVENMTITSGSMRRLVRESILCDDNNAPSVPVASTAVLSSTPNSASNQSDIRGDDVASWWENSNNDTGPKNTSTSTVLQSEGSNSSLPLHQSISVGSNSSSAPNQYRASLSTTIFGTLSKASGSASNLFNEANKDETASGGNGGISRHSSFRKGTLSRNTLRHITANATNGVNRSIKGLFDLSSSSINKVVPDDSQKMELDSEPIQIAVEERTVINPQEQIHQQMQYNFVRQKSLRESNTSKPNTSSTYLPSSESSTKYALSDEECIIDESSKKTAIDDEYQSLSATKNVPSKATDSKNQQKIEVQTSTSATALYSNTTHGNGEVDNIRRILQDAWINNMRESGSLQSIASDTDSISTTSTQQSGIIPQSPISGNSVKLNPRQQNQSLLTKSLLSQQVAKRASLVARTNMTTENIGFIPQQGPEPSASFSSSTVRTMVPENSTSISIDTEPINIQQNALASTTTSYNTNFNNGSNKIEESSFDDKSNSFISSSSVFINKFSTSPMDTTSSSSQRDSSADSSRQHSRTSSGGNSAATALRISSGYTANAKTWNGRTQTKSSRPSVIRYMNDDENAGPSTPGSLGTYISSSESPKNRSVGRSSISKRAYFSTMRKGKKNRGAIPWTMTEDEEEKRTPAQIERDRYLEGKY